MGRQAGPIVIPEIDPDLLAEAMLIEHRLHNLARAINRAVDPEFKAIWQRHYISLTLKAAPIWKRLMQERTFHAEDEKAH